MKKLTRRVGEGGQHTGGDAEWKKVVSRKVEETDLQTGGNIGS